MVHSIVLKFEKIWLSGTLIIIWKPKVWWMDEQKDGRTDMRILIYPRLSSSGGINIPPILVERGYKKNEKHRPHQKPRANQQTFMIDWNKL